MLPTSAEIAELRAGLALPLREIPCRYLYDALGSSLFEAITLLPEYYPTRVENALLAQHAASFGPARTLAELCPGTGRKTAVLLTALRPERVQLLDVSEAALAEAVERAHEAVPGIVVEAVAGDFLADLPRLGPGGDRLVVLLAGTIGNLHPDAVPPFLARVRAQMAPGDRFLVGVDTVKDPARLHAAYDDAIGLTAAFSKNLLRVVNTRFGADFDPADFDHHARWDAEHEWVDIRLVARRAVHVRLGLLETEIDLRAGEPIRTELSCKYTRSSFGALAGKADLRIQSWTTDTEDSFALVVLE